MGIGTDGGGGDSIGHAALYESIGALLAIAR